MKKLQYIIFIVFIVINTSYAAPFQDAIWTDSLNPQAMPLQINHEEDLIQMIEAGIKHLTYSDFSFAALYLIAAEQNSFKTSNELQLFDLNNALAKLYLKTELYTDALENSKKALALLKHSSNNEQLMSLILVADAYSGMANYDSANSYLNRALEIAQSTANTTIAAQIFTKLGNNAKIIDYGKALLYYQSANLLLQAHKNNKELAINYLSIGEVLYGQGNDAEAIIAFEKSLRYASEDQLQAIRAACSVQLGSIYLNQTQYSKALEYFMEVNEMDDSDFINEFKSQSYEASSLIYEKQGKLNLSLQHLKLSAEYHQKAIEFINRKQYESQMLQSDIRQTKSILSIQQLQNQISGKSSEYKTYLIITASFCLILIFFILLHYFRKRKHIKELRLLLQERKQEIESLNKALDKDKQTLEKAVAKRTEDIREELHKRKEIDIDLKKALKNAEDANYLKNAFLSNMSHEIRTPLNGIIGFSNLLVTELSIMENQELYEYASGIQESGDRLLHLLNNIIDISRIEANDMEVKLAPCRLNEIIESVSVLYKFKANEKKLKFNTKYSEVPEVLADEHNITKIISDIIDNAVKYTDKGFINVITEFDAADNIVIVSIKDTGIGIDDSYIDHVFEAFRQESLGYSRNYQGAGLGLPLAKRLISLMKGDILVESKKGVGTTVKIILRTSEEKAPELVTEKAIPEIVSIQDQPEDKKINIFIVEDDRMNRLVLSKMLDKVGENSLAVDGDDTLQIIENAYNKGVIFEVMLFDINLPAPWDGIKLMNEVKKRWKEYKYVPFIAQTAYAMAGDRERLLDAGFDNYIAKPVNKNELINLIFKHIGITKKS